MLGSMSIMHWAIVIGVVTVLFGRGKITAMMKDLGGGLKELKNGMRELGHDPE